MSTTNARTAPSLHWSELPVPPSGTFVAYHKGYALHIGHFWAPRGGDVYHFEVLDPYDNEVETGTALTLADAKDACARALVRDTRSR